MIVAPPENCDSMLVSSMPNIRYLTGFTGSSASILVTKRLRLFFTDFRYSQQASQQVRDFEVRVVNGSPLTGAARYAVARRVKIEVLGVEEGNVSRKDFLELRRCLPGIKTRDASGTVERLRQIKSKREVGFIRRAADIGDMALTRMMKSRVTGRSEREVAWMLESWMREAGSDPLPFDIIVASGRRSSQPHGIATEKVIRPDELVVIDLGAAVNGYCSDITRTFTTGTPGRVQEKIFEAVSRAQKESMAVIAPGESCAAVDAVARDTINAAGYGEYFGHSLGHGVGLEPHEAPSLSPRSTERLAAGMVVTVEPGIYKDRVGGVRIEDTVVVDSTGAKRLTTFPRGLRRLR